MPKRADVIAEARKWIGTPFHHQACKLGEGADCGQLVVGVGVALGLMPMPGPEWRQYGRKPNPRKMRAQLETFLDPLPADHVPRVGDIMWIGWRPNLPMHLGFYTDLYGSGVLHAFSSAGRVVETSFPPELLSTVDSWWTYRGLED